MSAETTFPASSPAAFPISAALLCSTLSATAFPAHYRRKSRSFSSSWCLISPGATSVDQSLHNMDRSRASSSFT
ncbi:hypothetical protein U1Q18_013577 [Sarracenia purpurea var. burkii]